MSDNYLEYVFEVEPAVPGAEILLAQLAEVGFESFVETKTGLRAYIQKNHWNETLLDDVGLLHQPGFAVQYDFREIRRENWNERWEKSFEPIVVADQCVVRAPFHKEVSAPYEIVIEPKMSFGTGHHETTYMMLQFLLGTDCKGLTVLDMGCGTSVLAIMAEMRGASEVDAIDIDSWCVENSIENCARNGCTRINVMLGDAGLLTAPDRYHLILANINRNILLSDIPKYRKALKDGGTMLLSGFYRQDLDAIRHCCADAGGKYIEHLTRNDWVAAKFVF